MMRSFRIFVQRTGHAKVHGLRRGVAGLSGQQTPLFGGLGGKDSHDSDSTRLSSCRLSPFSSSMSALSLPAFIDSAAGLLSTDETARLSVGTTDAAAADAAATAADATSSLLNTHSVALATSASASAVGPLMTKFLMLAPPLAAQVVFLAPMTAMRTFKKEKTTGDVSPVSLAAMCVNGLVWVSYGAMRGDPTIWACNISAFLFGSYYLYTFNKYKAEGVSMVPSLAGVAVAAISTGGIISTFDTDTAGQIIGHGGIGIVMVMFGGPLLSLKTVLKDKATKSIPFAFCLASFVNCILWTSYGYLVIDDYIVWLPNFLGLGFSTAQLALHAKFGIDSEAKSE